MAKHSATAKPRRRGRPPKGTRGDTRQELIDAALRLFARYGYAATSVRQIAAEVGIRDSAIYAHFDAKRDLLDALMEEAGPQLLDRLGIDFGDRSGRAPDQILPGLVEKLVDAWDRPRVRQLTSLLIREGGASRAAMVEVLTERLAPSFGRWVREKQLRGDSSAGELAWQFTAPLVAIRILYMNAETTPAERRDGRNRAAEHVRFFLRSTAP